MSGFKFLYKKAQLKDVCEIKQIELDCGLSPWSVKDYEEEIKINQNFIVCILKEKIVGFILARLITNYTNNLAFNNDEKERYCLDIKDSKCTEIETEILNIGVLKSFRRKNIGADLMNLIFEKMERYDKYTVILDVRVSNKSAIKFYKTFNFEIISRRKDLYSNPLEDGYTMKLKK